MSVDHLITGGGGGGGGSFRNVPDNLRSTDTYEILLGLAGSRTRLAPGGLKNLFVDDVPVEDGQGNPVFSDFMATLDPGDPANLNAISLKLGQSGGQTSVNVTLANSYTNGAPGEWVTAAITQSGAEFLDLRFAVQQLYKQTKKGIGSQTAHIEVEMRPSGSAEWINPLLDLNAPTYQPNGVPSPFGQLVYIMASAYDALDPTKWADTSPGRLRIYGKTTSTYIKELRIAVPSTGAYVNKTWEVRCRLVERDYVVTGDDGENEDRRSIAWESIAPVSTRKLGDTEGWRGVSFLQVYGKATDQISGLPELTGIYDFGMYPVPPTVVWNPETRVYTGATWDGVTTQLAWTACPAWQVKGLVEDAVSGVSALVPGSTMNKWDVLEASKWFATLVPDGKGGTHPRYSGNWFIDQPMQTHELVNHLAGAVGAHCWDEGDGRWRMRVEKPETPQIIFTKEMIEGEFVYSHTDFDSRFNDYTGVFRNKDNRYEEDRVRVWDQADIDMTGRRHTTIALVGCDNRQEALRRLKIRLLTSLNETRMVTFTTNRLGMMLEPLSVIAIADGDLNSNTDLRSTGRVVSMNAARTSITVRDTLRLEVGVGYRVNLTIPNPDYNPETTSQPAGSNWRKPTITITRNVVNTARGDILTLDLDQALPAGIPEFAPVALEAIGLPSLPKQYRVTGLQPSEDGTRVTVSAIEIYTAKWAESDAVTEEELNAQTVNRVAPSPTLPQGGMFEMREYTSEVGRQKVLVVSWLRPASLFVDDYRVEYSYNNGPWTPVGNTRDTYFEMPNPLQGDYTFRIYMRDRRGVESLPLQGTVTVDENAWVTPVFSLTNNAVVLWSDAAGNVEDFSVASGRFELRYPSGLITNGVTYSILSTTGGLDINIEPETGFYFVTGLSSKQGSAVLRAVFEGQIFDLTYSISKAVQGATAKTLQLTTSHTSFSFDKHGLAKPQTATYLATRINGDDDDVLWTVSTNAGAIASSVSAANLAATGLFTRVSDLELTQSEAQFANLCNLYDTSGFTLQAAYSSDPSIFNAISVVKIQDGADGEDGAIDEETLEQINGQIADAKQAIDDLFDTYGNTASAANSAAIAEAAVEIVNQARQNAEDARDDAVEARVAAESARNLAINARTAAQDARDGSQAARDAADLSRQAAEQAEENARVYATDADGYAQAASGSATVAEAKADDASQSAGIAQASNLSARLTAAYLLPSTFEQDGKFWSKLHSGSPESRTPIGDDDAVFKFADVAGEGRVIRFTRETDATSMDFAQIGVVKIAPGRRYRFAVRWRRVSGSGGIRLWMLGLNASYAAFTIPSATFNPPIGTNGVWYEHVVEVVGDTAITAGATWLRSAIRGLDGASTYEVSFGRTEDITESHKAALSAAAAYTSEQAASVHRDEAGVSAAASEINRVQAEAAAASASDAAQQALAVSVPDRYTTGNETNFSSAAQGSPDSLSTCESNATLSGFGPVFETSTTETVWAQKSVFSAIPGRVYEVTVEANVSAVDTTGGTPRLRAEWRCLDANFSSSSLSPVQRYNFVDITQTGTLSATLRVSDVANAVKGIQAWAAGSVHLRPYSRLLLNGGTATVQFKILAVRDITARIQAEIAASASADSANTAEAKANAAGASANAAQQAATNSQTHAGHAETFSIAAASSAADAEDARDEARLAATASAQSRNEAGDFATAASGHAQTAGTKATQAGQSAQAASGDADRAGTARSQAEAFRDQAATAKQSAESAESAASSSASIAASARDAALAVQKSLFTSDFNNGADYWVNGYAYSKQELLSAPSIESVTSVSLETVPGIGKVLQSTTYRTFSERTTRPVIDGQVLELSVRTRILTAPPSNNHRHYFFFAAHAVDGSLLGYTIMAINTGLTVAGGWQTQKLIFNPSAIKASGGNFAGGSVGLKADVAEWRLMLSTNLSGDVATQQIQSITIDDVTARENAKASAQAASTSESNAAASATTAGQRATAAQGSATTASTKAGEASTSASQASTSASNAQGFANTASTQAGVAAGHKDAAAGSASAAASSASTASTKATEATNAASAASASSLTAQASARTAITLDGNAFFDAGAEGWSQSAAGALAKQTTTQWNVVASYQGRSNVIVTPTGVKRDIFGWKTYPVIPGVKYKLRYAFFVEGPVNSTILQYAGIQQLDGAGAPVGTNNGYSYVVTGTYYGPSSSWRELEAIVDCDTLPAGVSQFRLISWSNYTSTAGCTVAIDHFYAQDATGVVAAQSQAQAAQQSAVDADASRAAASQSASTASTYRGQAEGFASTATQAASVATSAASAAQVSMSLAASMGTGALNLDADFQEFSGTVYPDRWGTGLSNSTYHSRAARSGGLGYAWRQAAPASANCYGAQRVNKSITNNGYYVIEADIKLNAGSMVGAGVLFRPYTATGNNRDITLAFATDPDESGTAPGAGVVGRNYRFRKLVQNTLASATYFDIYAMSHWSPLGSISAAADITFEHVAVRPATQGEIAAGVALPNLQASVSQQSQALTQLDTLNAVQDTRSVNSPPSYYWTNYAKRSVREFKTRTVIGVPSGPTYGILTTTVPWSDSSGGAIQQLFVSSDEKLAYSRYSTSTTAWSAWVSYVGDLTTKVGDLQTSYASLDQRVSAQNIDISNFSTALSTTDGRLTTLFAKQGVKLDVNGYVSGFEQFNTGAISAVKFRQDLFEISSPSGGQRTEYSNGNWRAYDSSNRLRMRWGVW